MSSNGIAGRLALVTGAAYGIGEAVAWELAERGATVALVDRDGAALDAVVGRLRDGGHTAYGAPVDVTDSSAVDEFVERVERTVAPLDFLVNVAGVLRTGPSTEMSDADWELLFAVNTTGVFHCCRSAARRMSPRGRGAIVTVASNAAGTPRMNMAAYGASKAASTSFTKALGLELAGCGIRCNVVAPGSTDTNMLRSMWQDENDRLATLDGVPSLYRTGIPLRKLADPRDIARAVAFLVSSDASHITMQEICVDGGAALGV